MKPTYIEMKAHLAQILRTNDDKTARQVMAIIKERIPGLTNDLLQEMIIELERV